MMRLNAFKVPFSRTGGQSVGVGMGMRALFWVVCCVGAGEACAASTMTAKYGDITWRYAVVSESPKTAKLMPNGTSPCVDASTTKGDITLPAKLPNTSAGYTITTLADAAFTNCCWVTQFTLPSAITKVYAAFANCTALTNVTFAASSIKFYANAFVNCPKFTSFTLADDAAASYAVENGVLYNADKTQLIRVPTGQSAVTIPQTVTKLCDNSFAHTTLATLALPPNLAELPAVPFRAGTSIGAFTIPDSNATFATTNGALYTKDFKTLVKCPTAATNLVISVGITNVAEYAFAGCSKLQSVVFPKTLAYLKRYVFSDATALTQVEFKGNVPAYETSNFGDLFTSTKPQVCFSLLRQATWEPFLKAQGYTPYKALPPKGWIITFQ